jgi:hypothetical protein
VNFKVTGDSGGSWYASGQDQQSAASFARNYAPEGFTTGFTGISTEMNNASPTQVADGTTSAASYGLGAGSTPSWYVYQQPMAGSAHRVGGSETTQFAHTNPGTTGSPGTWTVPNVPTPVTFKHSP